MNATRRFTGGPGLASNADKSGLSRPLGLMFMSFPTSTALRASPCWLSQIPRQPLIRTTDVSQPTCVVFYHPASRLAGQF
eukprot:365502-Chlamydomonas_euryale.AAC.2